MMPFNNTPLLASGKRHISKRHVLYAGTALAAAAAGWGLQREGEIGGHPPPGAAPLKQGEKPSGTANAPSLGEKVFEPFQRLTQEARTYWQSDYPVILPIQGHSQVGLKKGGGANHAVQISETAANLAQAQAHGAVLINFWATWCPPCVAELPLLSAFSAQMQGVAIKKRIVTLGVAVDKMAAVNKFLAAKPLAFASLVVDGSGIAFAKALGNTSGLPFSVLLAADGTVLHRHSGALEAADLQKLAKMV